MNTGIKDPMSLKRLEYWRGVVDRDARAWESQRDRMDWREELFEGTKKMLPSVKAEEPLKEQLYCYYVRNVVAENIESMVDSRVPAPKVQALRQQDEGLARSLEELLRFYVKRHHMRELNDLAERMGPIQGGLFWLVEWDDTVRTPDGPGDVHVSLIHPKQIIPQAGIYTDVEDMDHICIKLALTVGQVLRQYGVDVSDIGEEDPGARGDDGDTSTEDEIITVYQLYYKNGKGGVGLLAWCGDVLLRDLEDYQARRLRRCKSCGAVASYTQRLEPERREEMKIAGQLPDEKERCLWCEGTEFEDAEVDSEDVMPPGKTLMDTNGQEIHLKPALAYFDGQGRMMWQQGDTIPYYKPNLYPIILQRNISKFGQLLGESDVDKMEDQQNLIKRMDKKAIDRSVKAGTKISLPNDVNLEMDTEDQRVFRLRNPADAAMIKTYEFSGDISQVLEMGAKAYEEARQISGITDSMQGRRDPTATSAKAKEFSAAKSEGRMESRRVMKQEAWARMYELIAKLYLSCADEGRRVRTESATGEVDYTSFDRKQFLKKGEDGKWYYEDGFLFSVDDATSIGESREAMWQEINRSFSSGTLGNPQDLNTLVRYWGLMEEQAYPGAGTIKRKFQEEMEQQAAQQQAMQAAQAQGMPGQAMGAGMPAPQALQ